MYRTALLFFLLFAWHTPIITAQPAYTANDTVAPYTAPFGYGANMGAYPPWRDENLANVAAGNAALGLEGLGITTFRPELPELFVEYWGYDIRVEAFEHYERLGMKDHVLFIGHPSPIHRDSTQYCPGAYSKLFKNLYTPIWDGGANSTPVNDSNYFARYVYLLTQHYGKYIRFWEVWNEPDLDLSGNAILAPGQPGNWWEHPPGPCETQIHAPVFHYIRMLRIAYEVIKSEYPEDYVAVGGLGNPSYLDAILRYSDNPAEGKISAEYPLRGGAYFDGMSFHSYPHLDGSMRSWNNEIMGFRYNRHSDAAVDGMIKRRYDMEAVLFKYQYDGTTYPEKVWILTETNIPRKAFQPEYLGSAAAQRNFVIKALVASQMHNIRQFHIYSLADVKTEAEADYEFDMMGLVKNLTGTTPHQYTLTDAGIAYHTTATLLSGYTFDSLATRLLNLPDRIGGGAFRDRAGNYQYVLWAITQTDSSEVAAANYSFPKNMGIERLQRHWWNFSQHSYTVDIEPDNIWLSGTPVFLKAIVQRVKTTEHKEPDSLRIQVFPNPARGIIRLHSKVQYFGSQPADVMFFDLRGQLANRQQCPLNQRIDISHLPKGIYILKIKINGHRYLRRLVLY